MGSRAALTLTLTLTLTLARPRRCPASTARASPRSRPLAPRPSGHESPPQPQRSCAMRQVRSRVACELTRRLQPPRYSAQSGFRASRVISVDPLSLSIESYSVTTMINVMYLLTLLSACLTPSTALHEHVRYVRYLTPYTPISVDSGLCRWTCHTYTSVSNME